MMSDLLLLIKAQEPILPTAEQPYQRDGTGKSRGRQAHRDMAGNGGITIEIDGDESLCINGEAEQIQAALAKLIENAITLFKRRFYGESSSPKPMRSIRKR